MSNAIPGSTLNPELRRNFWLEFSRNRLLIPPVIYLLIYWSLYAGSRPESLANAVTGTSLTIFFVLTGLWGSKLAAGAVIEEFREHTWDLQRMSSLGAWSLSWGKLLGSVSYVWYCAAIPFVMYLLHAGPVHGAHSAEIAVLIVAGSLMVQALSMTLGLAALSRSGAPGRAASLLILGVMLVILNGLWAAVGLSRKGSTDVEILWWGYSFAPLDFWLVTVLVFLGWSLLACYRLMRNELQFHSIPWAWASFLLFLSIYVAGLPYGLGVEKLNLVDGTQLWLATLFFVAVGGTGIMVLADSKDIVELRKLFACARAGRRRRALTLVPVWFVSLALTLTALALNLIVLPATAGAVHTFELALTCLLLRDIGIFLAVNFGKPGRRRADAAAIFYIILLYTLVPGCLAAGGAANVAAWFYPNPEQRRGVLIVQFLQVFIAWAFVVKRWRERAGEAAAS